MAGRIITYRTRQDAADENQGLVEDVYRELHDGRPDGLRYATFRLGDGVSFVHAALLDDGRPNPLQSLPAFAAFQRGLAARCDVAPLPVDATLIGAYRLFDD